MLKREGAVRGNRGKKVGVKMGRVHRGNGIGVGGESSEGGERWTKGFDKSRRWTLRREKREGGGRVEREV